MHICVSYRCLVSSDVRKGHWRITEGCQLPCGWWESNPSPLQEQQVFFTKWVISAGPKDFLHFRPKLFLITRSSPWTWELEAQEEVWKSFFALGWVDWNPLWGSWALCVLAAERICYSCSLESKALCFVLEKQSISWYQIKYSIQVISLTGMSLHELSRTDLQNDNCKRWT